MLADDGDEAAMVEAHTHPSHRPTLARCLAKKKR
jgi:hypothetical protein